MNSDLAFEIIKWLSPALIVLIMWGINIQSYKKQSSQQMKQMETHLDMVCDETKIINEKLHKLEMKQNTSEIRLEQIYIWIGELREYIKKN